MKKALLLICLLAINLIVYAQAQVAPAGSVRINENTIVKDSAGVRYEYSAWKNLLVSGKYALKSGGSIAPGEFVLIKKAAGAVDITPMTKPRESEYFTTGKPFKWFSEKDINGHKWDAKTLAGKVVVLNFWFINCPPCRMEIPELNQLVEKYKDRTDVVFIAIALDEEFDLKKFFTWMPYNYNIVERGRYTAGKYGIKSYPTNVIIDRQGNVKFHSTGYGSTTPYWIDKGIEEAINAKM